jgi:chorismate mutase
MNLERDLQKLRKERSQKASAIAQLRKRSKDSISRPKAEKNMLSTDPRMQKI